VHRREIEQRRRRLTAHIERLRTTTELPPDEELLVMRHERWIAMELGEVDKALLAAHLRAAAVRHGGDMEVLHRSPRTKRADEHDAKVLYGHLSGDDADHVDKLVGALYDLVPIEVSRAARSAALDKLWPEVDFQRRAWSAICKLASDLAHLDASPSIDLALLGDLELEEDEDDELDEAFDEDAAQAAERQLERRAVWIGKTATRTPIGIPASAYQGRLRAFFDAFGDKGIRRLAASTRQAVALTVHTKMWKFEPEATDARWRNFVNFLERAEDLVEILLEVEGLAGEALSGGPFAARPEDLSTMVISSTALDVFVSRREDEFHMACNAIGEREELSRDEKIAEAGKAWERVFTGVPALRDLIDRHLPDRDYGIVVEDVIGLLPRKPTLGQEFVEDDESHLPLDQLARVFCFGCDLLAGGQGDLRVWLAMWLGALRPRECLADASRLVPFGDGLLYVIARRFGKRGRSEVYFPRSGLDALRVTARHFVRASETSLDPTAVADRVCRRVRDALAVAHQNDPLLPAALPDRLAYVVRKEVADVVRRNQDAPYVVTKALGHESEVSDATYTQISRSEEREMLATLLGGLAALIDTEKQPETEKEEP
jgi:hypothetical protein